MADEPGRLLWTRWTLANGVGELVGLGATFGIGWGSSVSYGRHRGFFRLS